MERSFYINYTTDLHGYVFPTDYLDQSVKEQGLARLCGGFIKNGNALTIDGGDVLQGSPFTTMLHKLRPDSTAMADSMNRAGYDYVTPGNHDFNYGLEHLKSYLTHLHARCLCCNLRDKKGELPIEPYHIHVLENGLRIGLIGAVTHFILQWEKKETVDQLLIENPYDAVRRLLPVVRAQCDVLVVFYHGGFEKDVETGKSVSQTDENQGWLLAGLPGVDILLTGHQHQRIANQTVQGTPVVQAGCNALCFADVRARVDDQGAIKVSSRLVPAAFAPDDAMLKALKKEEDAVQRALDEPLSELDTAIPDVPPLERALTGSLAANFINQVQKEVSGAPVSACAIAPEHLSMPRRLTVREVLAAYPFANTLFVLSMTGEMLRRYVETTLTYFEVIAPGAAPPKDSPVYPMANGGLIAVSEPFLKPKIAHYNYDFFSGLDYVFDVRRPPMHRLASFKKDGQEIVDEQTYTVCLNSYRAAGSGGYDFLRGAKVLREIQRDVATLMMEYLSERPRADVDQTRYLRAVLP